jgi:L-asparaginase
MPRVVVLTTGGTIASRSDPTGTRGAVDTGEQVVARLARRDEVDVVVLDVLRVGSYALTPADQQRVAEAVQQALADDSVDGVVVTHGTDTMEETAYLLDLLHDDDRPVVLTGAQRSADDPSSDGPANLGLAVTAAVHPRLRGHGVLVAFDGRVLPAQGTRKVHTLASAAFDAPDTGPVAVDSPDGLHIVDRPRRRPRLRQAGLDVSGVRVDIVALYAGADATALEAHVAAGARGVVLEATGAGNAPPAVAPAVARAVADGVTVLLSTRVHAGPVAALYGAGGGVDLVAAGAIPTGLLRPSQARMALLALLGAGATPQQIRSFFASDGAERD